MASGVASAAGFNPDFFLLPEGAETVVVVETKMDGDITDQNRGKLKYAIAHFKTVNEMLAAEKADRRYAFHYLSPADYSRFFASLRDGKLDEFTSTLHAALLAEAKPIATRGPRDSAGLAGFRSG